MESSQLHGTPAQQIHQGQQRRQALTEYHLTAILPYDETAALVPAQGARHISTPQGGRAPASDVKLYCLWAGKMSPRSCISTLPGLRAGGKRQLPMWARALSNASNSHLLEEWNQQQSLLASMHLHPHEVHACREPVGHALQRHMEKKLI